jgi:peptidoglycan-N-acetylglucosamine deacetylase
MVLYLFFHTLREQGNQNMSHIIPRPSMFKKKLLTHLFGTITGVKTNEPIVALTFDDGPDPIDTTKLLDLLEHHNIQATFFVLGLRVLQHPELIDRMVKAGHALGNHSWSHKSMPTLNSYRRLQEIKKTHNIIKPHGEMLFRPPFGHMDWPTCYDVRRCGYRLVTWNMMAFDWLDHCENEIMTAIESKLRPGGIVLLHDSLYTFERNEYRNREPLIAALHQLFTKLGTQYSFVTLPELLKRGPAIKVYRHSCGDSDWLKGQMSMRSIN